MDYNEKDEILEVVSEVIGEKENLDFAFLFTTLLSMVVVVTLAFPKVFLHSSIYYKSREISTLEREYKSLKEEHKIISSQVEQKRFKNQILDTLF